MYQGRHFLEKIVHFFLFQSSSILYVLITIQLHINFYSCINFVNFVSSIAGLAGTDFSDF